MRRIIDVRLRPPLGSFLASTMFKNKPRTARMTDAMGMEPAPSLLKESMELLIQEMDSLGNYLGCVSGSKRGIDRAWGWIENQDVFEMVQQYPDRFIGVGTLDVSDAPAALEDLEACVARFGFKAIAIEPGTHEHSMYADDRRLYPVYERCAELGLPVLLLAGGNAGPDITYSDPAHVERVAIDLPRLKVVVLHGAWPWVTHILHIAFRRPNVYLSADMYLTMPGGSQYIEAINSYLSDRYLYGTSYPFGPVVGYFERFQRLGIQERYMDRVLYQNAEILLGLRGPDAR
jgi:predicted TIM-barrel fold metal-dependent hydrolase